MTNLHTLTTENHGKIGNPHPQYDPMYSIETAYERESKPWMFLMEFTIAQKEQEVLHSLSRIAIGFEAFDIYSDNIYTRYVFNGAILSDFKGKLNLGFQKTPTFTMPKDMADADDEMNLFWYYKQTSTGVYSVKLFMYLRGNYKALTIMKPWVNLPAISKSFIDATYPPSLYLFQFEKMQYLFSPIEQREWLTEETKTSLVTGYTEGHTGTF